MSHGSRTWSQRRLTQVWTEGFKRKWRALKAEPQGNKKRMLNKCASLTAGGELLRGKSPRSKSAAVLYKQEKLRAVTCIPPCLHSSWLPMPSFSHTHTCLLSWRVWAPVSSPQCIWIIRWKKQVSCCWWGWKTTMIRENTFSILFCHTYKLQVKDDEKRFRLFHVRIIL